MGSDNSRLIVANYDEIARVSSVDMLCFTCYWLYF